MVGLVLISLMLLLLSSVVCASQEGLPEFAITSIDVQPVGGGAPKNRVKFHSLIRGHDDDTDACILRDIIETNETETTGMSFWKKEYPVFHATKITEGQLQSNIPRKNLLQKKKILLCVHGFNVTPQSFLKQVAEKSEKFHEHEVIPVIWPCEDKGIRGYLRDRKTNAPGAAKALESLIDCYKNKKKSIMCHSMGNYVLKNVAEEAAESESKDPDYKPFDNIFMVAADVRCDIFAEKYNKDEKWGEVPPVLRLARKKVYVLHCNKDKAMWGRRTKWYNGFRKALGQDGCNKDEVSKSSEPRIFNRNCNDINKGTGFNAHSYHFKHEAIRMYEKPKLIEML